ncbi:PREDICTED: uncharacterized protein LOC108361670 [Rhagoletis zephyria]|uniref:uncharacterized protein LOC108361670 n=1 Tax=Rhagoletis zephyria TaxID=28612 RepID=UPI00081174CD|nr:PREDICTED: uncharacterized protein LOC108361670 [Rhagoletis zephyria]XP_036334606.1 uncharacterized protein LOC118745189 [Rhagoletis pomonella]
MGDLIAEVRKREFLWNKKKIPLGKRKRTTEKLWQEVADACSISKTVAKTRWRSIRDQFLKEVKKVPVYSSGESYYIQENKKSKYTHFNNLIFLLDTDTPRQKVIEIKPESIIGIRSSETSNSWDDSKSMAEDFPHPLPMPQPENLPQSTSTDNTITSIGKVYALEEDLDPNLCEVIWKEESDALVFDEIKNQSDDGVPRFGMIKSQPANPTYSGSIRVCPQEGDNKADVPHLKDNYYKCPDIRVALELENQTQSENCTEENENLLFLRSLLPYMNKMDPMQQFRVRMLLANNIAFHFLLSPHDNK